MRKHFSLLHFMHKTSTGAKSSRFRFDKINGYIKIHDRIRYLVLFDYERFDKICDRIKYLISEKKGITDSNNQNSGRIRIELYNSLPIAKILTFHNIIIVIKSVLNKNKNEYYYIIFLEKVLYKDKSNTEYF